MSIVATIDRTEQTRITDLSRYFTLSDGRSAKTILIPALEISGEWELMQNASLDEYEIHHNDGYPSDVLIILRHFSGFCSRWLKGTVLDVGCGVSQATPLYARNIGHINYVGLDPLRVTLERDYPFLCGRIEDGAMIFDRPLFDGAIFSTSLDHIDNLEECGAALTRLCKTGAIIVLWIGIHDPASVGKMAGLAVFDRVLTPLFLPVSWVKLLVYSTVHFPRLMNSLSRTIKNYGTVLR
jgi:SAM-dependent methyltransferase